MNIPAKAGLFPRIRPVAIWIAVAAGWLPFTAASAVEFTIVGPRAMGMGGAGVAVTTDSLATYWNPAGLAMQQSVDIRIQGGAQLVDRLGIKDTLDDINGINRNDISAANINRLQGLLNSLNGASISAAGAAGVYLKGYYGNHAFGFNVSDVATGGLFTSVPLTAALSGTTLNVSGQLAIRGLEARQAGLSYAYTFADRKFSVGATVKMIQGAAYSGQVNVFGSNGGLGFTSDLGKAAISTTMGVDVGALYRPVSWLRMGVVAKDLNQPAFDAPGGGQFKLLPQVRGGIAVNPSSSLTLTADGDITANQTLVPGLKSRVVSVGAEQMLFDFLALRAGALKNIEDAKSTVTPTAGLGIRIFALRLDIAGGYDFRQRGALASGSLAMTF